MDEYEQARRQGMDVEKVGNSQLEWKCTHFWKTGNSEDSCFKRANDQGGRQRGIVCFNCDKPGHNTRWGPNNVALLSCESKDDRNKGMYCKGLVEGPQVDQILLVVYNGM